jgi:hypothetical protein
MRIRQAELQGGDPIPNRGSKPAISTRRLQLGLKAELKELSSPKKEGADKRPRGCSVFIQFPVS